MINFVYKYAKIELLRYRDKLDYIVLKLVYLGNLYMLGFNDD